MASNSVLDTTILDLGSGDRATGRDFVQNVFVSGVTGGGKTSGPGQTCLTGLAKTGAGGVIACVKPSEADEVCAILERAGRGGSIIRWNGRNGGFNFLAYALARFGPDGISSLIGYLLCIVEMIRNAGALRGGDGDAFWIDELKRVLAHLLLPLWRVTGTVRLCDIIAFVRSAPTSLEQMRDPAWQRDSFFYQIMAAAAALLDDATGEQLMDYWREFAQMDGKLRSSILAGLNMLDRFNHGWLRHGLAGETNIVPSLCFHGAIIVLDMSRATHGEDGIVAQMVFIDAFQTEVLGRNALAPEHRQRLVFCYADEFQEVVTSRWAEFLALSRSSRCSTIGLTQSLPGLYAKLGGQNAHDRAHHLIANMGVRIFCANNCTTTNQWASETIGKGVQRRASFQNSEGTNTSYGMNMGESAQWNREARDKAFLGHTSGFGWSMDAMWGQKGSEGGGDQWGRNRGHGSNRGTSQGWSEQVDWLVEPAFFSRGLKTGGPAHGNRVSAIWAQAGRRFAATGGPSLLVEFAQ